MYQGHFGLEKESLRVTAGGFLSHTKHPFPDDPRMERDFCENQTELITDAVGSAKEAWEELASLHKKAVTTLLHLKTGKELLWPFSNPPYVKGEKDIPIATYKGELKGKEIYREYLAAKYGKRKMLFSGIHFNFSFSEPFLEDAYRDSGKTSRREFQDHLYLELSKKSVKYSWLLVYLMAASPVMDGSYFPDGQMGTDVFQNLASPRCSQMGYWNPFDPILNYDTLENYIQSIESYVASGQLREAAELYYPVRLKPHGVNSLERLREHGVDHIELRTLDLNPLDPVGIKKEDVAFLHLFLLYLTSLEDEEFPPLAQLRAIKNEKKAAAYEDDRILIETGWNTTMPVRNAAILFLTSMERFFLRYGRREDVEVIHFQERKIFYPEERYAVRVKEQFETDYVKHGLELAKGYASRIDEEQAG
jgi:glutamate--cysteine ligase